ncbi:MAG: threonine--tRNA ligase [Candidatus Omnitrophota bacterium]|nr:MAG: threonine--tRNA ligase [Candidatus Omnitrophota bacterium]
MELSTLRHSCAHILAQAVKEIYPEVKLAIGPAIEQGYYYDFAVSKPFTPQDLINIEQKMRKIIKADLPFSREEWNKQKARDFFSKAEELYKLELIEAVADQNVFIYKTGNNFVDLCKGPHIESTGKISAFKLLSIAGAYWRGDEHKPMLQRIYGTCFNSKQELADFLRKRVEAEKRDHRKLGKELEFFEMGGEIGAGLVLYLPKGALLRTIIEDYEKAEHLRRGYKLVVGPHILKSDIWVRSGHYDYYKENMYTFQIDGQEYALKPMNCPAHMIVYQHKIRSYRELPLRLFELGTVYRNEKSGVLHGLLRVRGFTQDDAHIFCTKAQLKTEIKGVIDFVVSVMDVFGFNDLQIELSTRPEKSIGTDEDWQDATLALQDSLKEKALSFDINAGDGAFYGPIIDIKIKDALGRAWQCATIQCDFALPERFGLTYIASDGTQKRPVMLHRVILGSIERFIGTLLEHYGGALPLWLSPVQVKVIAITQTHHKYAEEINQALGESQIRVELDLRNEKVGYKIREAVKQKIPYIIVVGDKESDQGTISVRFQRGENKGKIENDLKIENFINNLKKEILSRKY